MNKLSNVGHESMIQMEKFVLSLTENISDIPRIIVYSTDYDSENGLYIPQSLSSYGTVNRSNLYEYFSKSGHKVLLTYYPEGELSGFLFSYNNTAYWLLIGYSKRTSLADGKVDIYVPRLVNFCAHIEGSKYQFEVVSKSDTPFKDIRSTKGIAQYLYDNFFNIIQEPSIPVNCDLDNIFQTATFSLTKDDKSQHIFNSIESIHEYMIKHSIYLCLVFDELGRVINLLINSKGLLYGFDVHTNATGSIEVKGIKSMLTSRVVPLEDSFLHSIPTATVECFLNQARFFMLNPASESSPEQLFFLNSIIKSIALEEAPQYASDQSNQSAVQGF